MPTIMFLTIDDEEIKLPAKYEVCPCCDGEGSVTNPSIGAITGEEWHRDWSPDEQDDYLQGVYDVPCGECKGNRVVAVLARDAVDAETLKAYDQAQREIAETYAIERAERAMGA